MAAVVMVLPTSVPVPVTISTGDVSLIGRALR